MASQCDVCACRRLASPQGIGDAGRWYASVEIYQQQREQFALLAPTKLEPLSSVDFGSQGTQDAEPRLPGHGLRAEFHMISVFVQVPPRDCLSRSAHVTAPSAHVIALDRSLGGVTGRVQVTLSGIGPLGSHGCSAAASSTFQVPRSITPSAGSITL